MNKNINRRKFVKNSLNSLFSLGLVSCLPNKIIDNFDLNNISSTNNFSKGKKVCIIGAGMAGISAAYHLQKQGGFDVTVFEARDRLGGRVFSKNSPDGVIAEIGANWIHGHKNNPLIDLCDKFGYTHLNTYDEEFIPLFSKGNWLDKDTVEDLREEYEKYIHYATSSKNSNLSVEELFWQKAGNSKNKDILKHLLRTSFTEEYAAEANLVTAKVSEMDDSFKGGNHVILQGYSRLIESLASGVNYKLNTIVKRILYKKNTVQIQTLDNSYNFDFCIVTVPLGVLKNKSIEFLPSLPDTKLNSINKIGFGHFAKLIVTFPESFWDIDPYFIEYFDNNDKRIAAFFNAYKATNKNTLIAIAGGKNALEWQSQGLDNMVERFVQQLKLMYKKNIPTPTSAYLSEWSKDPYSLGAYSYLANGSTIKDIENLAKPVDNTIFFAGEACHSTHMSTVHGAYISGIDVSKKLITLK
ncbi:MAG: FAD-dependent oxidoreductase [Candidatus Sericytochromatia bacterium]